MLTPTMEAAFNEQLKWEFYSAYLYLSMQSYYQDLGLPGFANWMNVQYQEETMHAMKMYNYILECGGKVQLQAVDAPPHAWKSPLDCFESALEHEKVVTKRINDLTSLAQKENDHASFIFLQWYVTEQVEELSNFTDAVNKVKLVGDGGGLFMLDRELATRVYTPPAAA